MDGVETWRVYSAEASVRLPRALETPALLSTVPAFVQEVQSSSWWRWHVRDDVTIKVEIGGKDEGGMVNSFAHPLDDVGAAWRISMHPQQTHPLQVLHEVAHCIQPRWRFGGPTPEGQLPRHGTIGVHSPEFTGTLVALAREFITEDVVDELEDAFAHFRVPVMPFDQVQAAMLDSRRAAADLAAFFEAAPPEVRAMLGAFGIGGVPRVHELGIELYMARTKHRLDNGRRPSQKWAAERIAEVTTCTARDVSRVERLLTDATRERDYKVALGLAVLWNIDPVKVQYGLRLDRDDWDIPLKQLRPLNPSWVSLVEELNDLISARPARWNTRR